MSNKTEINPTVNATVIKSELGQATAINTSIITESSKLNVGTFIDDKYEVLEPLSVSTGEADLYVCKYNNKEYVAKVYRRQRAVKPEVINLLKAIDFPHIAKLYDAGTYNNLPYEILPYYKNGSLQGKKYSLDELKNSIIMRHLKCCIRMILYIRT